MLLKSLRFWIVSDLPIGLLVFALQKENSNSFLEVSVAYAEEMSSIKSLRNIVAAPEENRMSIAAAEGQLSVIKFLYISLPHFLKDENVCIQATKGGFLDCLQFTYEHGCPWTSALPETAALNGRAECLQYVLQRDCPFNRQTLCQQGFLAGHVKCLQIAHSFGCELLLNTQFVAAGAGGLECLKYAHEHQVPISILTSVGAAAAGNIACLHFLKEKGYAWSRQTCQSAAKYGQLECLKYAHEQGSLLTRVTSESAAEYGHLPCLQYVHEHGGEWTERSVVLAAKGGHADCLQYLLERTVASTTAISADKLSTLVALHCAEQGNLALLQLAHRYGCPWNTQTCAVTARNGHLGVLRYLHENNCPWDEDTCTAAARNGHLNCLKYAHENYYY